LTIDCGNSNLTKKNLIDGIFDMKLHDILPVEKWIEFEKEINERSGLNASVFDAEGIRITDFKRWANRLCPAIKANENGQRFICAAAHLVIASQAIQTQKPVMEACDAGLLKLAVPIFVNHTFLGVAGCCGLLSEDNEVQTYMVHKTAGIDLGEIENLVDGIDRMDHDQIDSIIAYIQKRLDAIVNEFKKNPGFTSQESAKRF